MIIKKLMIECEVDIPPEYNVELFCKLMHDFIIINRFVLSVNRVTAYPPNTKLIVQDIRVPTIVGN